jgi:hypothetical protein
MRWIVHKSREFEVLFGVVVVVVVVVVSGLIRMLGTVATTSLGNGLGWPEKRRRLGAIRDTK